MKNSIEPNIVQQKCFYNEEKQTEKHNLRFIF